MNKYVLNVQEAASAGISVVGGKAANLGELYRIGDIQVPAGFCISTEAYSAMLQHIPLISSLLERLALLKLTDRRDIAFLSAEIRELVEQAALPTGIIKELNACLDENKAYAIRSSATAEDLPAASFAGQQDTYLNISGMEQVLKHISKCQASLFTERAVVYRIQNGIDHRKVMLAVLVQEMVLPEASGILFTADPVTGNRKTVSIDAGFGLGEALVSGLVSADCYTVQGGEICDKIIATKKLAIYGSQHGGTETRELTAGQQKAQTLTDGQILQLAAIGRKIETHFGSPQDIEWCLAQGQFYIVQSRPITTLFPVPEVRDKELHIYISVGHNQMMTDAMKPLGLSFFLQTTRAPMTVAGGRLFVDVTKTLASPAGRKNMIDNFGKTDQLIKDALLQAAEKVKPITDSNQDQNNTVQSTLPELQPVTYDPALVAELIAKNRASVAALKQKLSTTSGLALFDAIQEDQPELKRVSFDPQSSALIMTTMNASLWLNEKMYTWLGEKNAADILTLSVPNNITAQMGLDLMDVADCLRPYPELVSFLQQLTDNNFLEELPRFDGGKEAQKAIQNFLDQYGMRCAGEIDITRPRWSEKPLPLVPILLGNIRNFAPGESTRRFEQGRVQALEKAQQLLERLEQLPDGAQKARETKQMIAQVRNFSGYREYPKYGIVSRYMVYKLALLEEAKRLAQAGVLTDPEDCYYLSFEEFRAAVQTLQVDQQLISQRKEAFKLFEKLSPPRVMSSDGEIITGKYKTEHLPAGAIAGLPVSSGVIEGRARVILDMAEAGLEEGDILVTKFTDPSWTPLFVSIKGLVTEVGGLMTHGAVIAREYGIVAVVGIENVTALIKDGQRIRVNGTDGYVELL